MAKKGSTSKGRGGASATGRPDRPVGRLRTAKRRTMTPWLVGGGVLLLFAGPLVVNAVQRANLPGEHVRSLGHAHIAETAPTPRYNSNPPTSGPHYARVAAPGAYVEVLPDPLLVHNMEDGYVVLWYRLGDEEHNRSRIAEYEEAARGFRLVVIAPREDMEHEYALTAWQRIDAFDEFDADRVRTFVQAFHGIDNHPR